MPSSKKRKIPSADTLGFSESKEFEKPQETVAKSQQARADSATTEPDSSSSHAMMAKPNCREEDEPSAPNSASVETEADGVRPSPAPAGPSAAAMAQERMTRFRALQERAKKSAAQNFKEATRESQRQAADPAQLTALGRKGAIASHKLLKADVEEAGGDFERKRAWDWTIEESERWDRRVRKKEAHRDDTAFRDYQQESQKAYKKQVRALGAPDLEKYTMDKMKAIEKAAAAGTLEIVETEDGELVAVDKEGTFFSSIESTSFGQNKPDKAAVDRLVADLRRAEEASLKKRRERMAANGDDEDVTYINEKNKQFNQKLNRFYNKYTTEIRESFERGTAI